VPSRYFIGAFWLGFAVEGRHLFEKKYYNEQLKASSLSTNSYIKDQLHSSQSEAFKKEPFNGHNHVQSSLKEH
jgi:hypothetical protein